MTSINQHQKTILVISFSDLARDPRVNRQIRFLSERYHVIAAGIADPGVPGVEFIQILTQQNNPPAQPSGTRKGTGQLRYAVRRLQRLAPGNGQLSDDLSMLARPAGGSARAIEDMADTAVQLGYRAYRALRGKVYLVRKKTRGGIRRADIYWRLLSGQHEHHYWTNNRTIHIVNTLSHVKADLILINDIDPLPFGLQLAQKQGARTIFDAHEYFPRQYENIRLQRIVYQGYRRYICNTYIPQVDAMMTVGQNIADQYERDNGVRPLVLTNAAAYVELSPVLRPETEPRIRMVHHGRGNRSRKIEHMMMMMDHLDDRFALDLLLVASNPDDRAYIEELKQRADSHPRIRMLDPIPMQELIPFSHQYDIGLFLLDPMSFSYLHALPNKFFEFLQARLAIAIGPSPEMARIVKTYDCGVVSDDFSPHSLAEQLQKLDHAKINYYKQQAHKAASELNAETNRTLLLDLVQQVLG